MFYNFIILLCYIIIIILFYYAIKELGFCHQKNSGLTKLLSIFLNSKSHTDRLAVGDYGKIILTVYTFRKCILKDWSIPHRINKNDILKKYGIWLIIENHSCFHSHIVYIRRNRLYCTLLTKQKYLLHYYTVCLLFLTLIIIFASLKSSVKLFSSLVISSKIVEN